MQYSLHGMDIHYLIPSEGDLMNAVEKFTLWLDEEIESTNKMLTKSLTKAS